MHGEQIFHSKRPQKAGPRIEEKLLYPSFATIAYSAGETGVPSRRKGNQESESFIRNALQLQSLKRRTEILTRNEREANHSVETTPD